QYSQGVVRGLKSWRHGLRPGQSCLLLLARRASELVRKRTYCSPIVLRPLPRRFRNCWVQRISDGESVTPDVIPTRRVLPGKRLGKACHCKILSHNSRTTSSSASDKCRHPDPDGKYTG